MLKAHCRPCFYVLFSILPLLTNSIAFAKDSAYKAGFDCSKARTDAEKYICSDKTIAGLDFVLNNVYISQLKSLPKEKQDFLKKTQKTWLKERNNCIDLLQTPKYFCMLEEYRSRIIELNGIQQLIAFYKTSCATDDWDCEIVGDLELSDGKLSEAVKYYSIMCDADHDGDGGDNCYKKASVLEKQGKISEAEALYASTCKSRQHIEACAAAQRLGSKPFTPEQWGGLYRSENGVLFINEQDSGDFTIQMDTSWANGHSCSYYGEGSLENGKATIKANPDIPECVPDIIKKGTVISIKDPTDKCRPACCGLRGVFEDAFDKE